MKWYNFKDANLTRTYWFNVQKLNLSLVGKSYLKNLQLRQLLVTGLGQDKNFDRQNLRGVNFKGARLVDASFVGTDLSEANLQDVDLSRAKLIQTQLDRTDLTGATLTGATIEDWGITSHTILRGVRCEYIVNAHQIGGNINNNTSQQKSNSELVKTILILAANPKTTSPLRLDEEVREIEEGLKRARKRDQFDLKQKWAVRIQDVYQSLLDFKPQIVHFGGHGAGNDGLVLEDETGNVQLVEATALASLFELFANDIECVVLNACYSEVQVSAIVQHIPYVIGMKKEVGDRSAIKFATGFYSALGAGESVQFAYKLGCSVIQLDGIVEHLTPMLKKK